MAVKANRLSEAWTRPLNGFSRSRCSVQVRRLVCTSQTGNRTSAVVWSYLTAPNRCVADVWLSSRCNVSAKTFHLQGRCSHYSTCRKLRAGQGEGSTGNEGAIMGQWARWAHQHSWWLMSQRSLPVCPFVSGLIVQSHGRDYILLSRELGGFTQGSTVIGLSWLMSRGRGRFISWDV